MKKRRLQILCSLLFLCIFCLGFRPIAPKTKTRVFPMPGTFEETWEATIETLESEEIPLLKADNENRYIQSKTFPVYKKEYKIWAKAPTFSSQGFCMVEIGLDGVEGNEGVTMVGIKAYFKRKHGFHLTGFGSRDSSTGVFERLLVGRINDKLVKKKYPKLKNVILGCNIRFDENIGRYIIAEAHRTQLAYEQGLRDGDVLLKIDGTEVSPANLFNFFLGIEFEERLVKFLDDEYADLLENMGQAKIFGEKTFNFLIKRKNEKIEIPVSVFYIGSEIPRFGMTVVRDEETRKFRVVNVRRDSPADKANIKRGDSLIAQNGILFDGWINYYRASLAGREHNAHYFQIEREGLIFVRKIPLNNA